MLRVRCAEAGNGTSALASEGEGTRQSTFSVLPGESTFITLSLHRPLSSRRPAVGQGPALRPPRNGGGEGLSAQAAPPPR